jgi:hypothetical protein
MTTYGQFMDKPVLSIIPGQSDDPKTGILENYWLNPARHGQSSPAEGGRGHRL